MIVYNEELLIAECLKELVDNGFDDFVILDMMSTDGTKREISRLLGKNVYFVDYPRMSLILYGYAQARNVCVSFAQRDWVFFVDADEILVDGVSNRAVVIDDNLEASVYFITRDNLMRNAESEIYVYLTEQHKRLYRPSPVNEWRGYIHEEIATDNPSGVSKIKLRHHSALKDPAHSASKSGMYSMMLLRLYNDDKWKSGVNEWWYHHYIPDHLSSIQAEAYAYAQTHNIPRNFFESSGEDDETTQPVLHQVSADEREQVFQTNVIRNIHALPARPWTGSQDFAFWAEWDHPAEGTRNLSDIVADLEVYNWKKFIEPGAVCIDVGGHSGDTAIPMALFASDRSQLTKPTIVVVEPNPALAPLIKINLTINSHLADFRFASCAITPEDIASIKMADHGNAQCNGGVLNQPLSQEASSKIKAVAGFHYQTRGVSMATLFEEIKLSTKKEKIGFIKLDCEGFDKEIIKPCKALFSIDKPVLYIEWFDWFTPEDDRDLFDIISSIDYIAFSPADLRQAAVERRVHDLICIHRSLVAGFGL